MIFYFDERILSGETTLIVHNIKIARHRILNLRVLDALKQCFGMRLEMVLHFNGCTD